MREDWAGVDETVLLADGDGGDRGPSTSLPAVVALRMTDVEGLQSPCAG